MNIEAFGVAPDGQLVERVTLEGGGLTARVMSWGAVLQDLRLAGHDAPLVLGFDRFEDYPRYSPYYGANVGRFANRIAKGHFSIDGQSYKTEHNFLNKHTIHGGSEGLGRKIWQFEECERDRAVLSCRAYDGEMGFPGNLDVRCVYHLKADGCLSIEFTGQTDAPTLCNIAHHSYFNLDDGGHTDILDHRIQIYADSYLELDSEAIPTGVLIPLDGTALDLRVPRKIRNNKGAGHLSFDYNYCLSSDRGVLKQVASVWGAKSGVQMDVWTTEPGIQFYDGARAGQDRAGLDGIIYPAFSGLCLEPQIWPDAPNHRDFPQAFLHPGEIYRQMTEYRFRQNE